MTSVGDALAEITSLGVDTVTMIYLISPHRYAKPKRRATFPPKIRSKSLDGMKLLYLRI